MAKNNNYKDALDVKNSLAHRIQTVLTKEKLEDCYASVKTEFEDVFLPSQSTAIAELHECIQTVLKVAELKLEASENDETHPLNPIVAGKD